MAALGLLEEVYRLPMVPPREASRAKIRQVLGELKTDVALVGEPFMTLAAEVEALSAAGAATDRQAAREAFARLRAQLSSGEVRAAEPDPSTATGWRVNTWVKQGILLGFRFGDIADMSADHGTLAVLRQGHAAAEAARRGRAACASCPAGRRCGTARTSAGASSACRRCTSTSAPGSARARSSIRTRSSARARRSAAACT